MGASPNTFDGRAVFLKLLRLVLARGLVALGEAHEFIFTNPPRMLREVPQKREILFIKALSDLARRNLE